MDQRIALVAEDALSAAVAERVVNECGRSFIVARCLIERGFTRIRSSIGKYRQASHVLPHIVLTDLDKVVCPAKLRSDWGAVDLPDRMLFSVAVREVESWILGDRDGFSSFAAIAANKVPLEPERLEDPKQALVNLVRRSRNRRLIAELVPPKGSQVSIGPLYNERLTSFVRDHWHLEAAVAACPSLRRMQTRVSDFLRLHE